VTTDDDQRIAYLTGEGGEALTPEERADLDELRGLLGAQAVWDEPPDHLEDSIVAAIEQEARASGRAARPRRRWLSLPRPAFALGAVATAAAIAVLAIVLATRSTGPAPLHFAMVIRGTPLAPYAHGSATLEKTGSGWRAQLSVTGLPHIEGGRYYQAWLKNSAGVLVPIGTFNDAAHVTLWSGVPVTQFRTLTVTVQRVGGGPASSGVRVLIGTITGKR
jgi:hypothetical protein